MKTRGDHAQKVIFGIGTVKEMTAHKIHILGAMQYNGVYGIG